MCVRIFLLPPLNGKEKERESLNVDRHCLPSEASFGIHRPSFYFSFLPKKRHYLSFGPARSERRINKSAFGLMRKDATGTKGGTRERSMIVGTAEISSDGKGLRWQEGRKEVVTPCCSTSQGHGRE